jgi:formylglycine-generating enzyme required for sulfatase activity
MRRVSIAQINNAISLEREYPQQALQCYQDLEKQNRAFQPKILIASIVYPLIGATITYFLTKFTGSRQTFLIFLILCFSFGPAFKLLADFAIESGIQKPPDAVGKFFNFFVLPAITILGDVLQFVLLGLLAGISAIIILLPVSAVRYFVNGAPFLWPQDLPFMLINGTTGFFILFWAGIAFSNLSFKELFTEPFFETLSLIPIGMAYKASDILQLFGALLLGLVVSGTGPLGLVYDSLWQILLIIGLTGLLLGFGISHPDDPKMTPLINLGLSRTYLILGNPLRARYLAMQVYYEVNTFKHENLEWIARLQLGLLSPKRRQATIKDLAEISLSPEDRLSTSRYDWAWQEAMLTLKSLDAGAGKKKRSTTLLTFSLAITLLLAFALGGLGLASLTESILGKMPEESDGSNELALLGVEKNSDWQPYIEDINSVEMALVPAGCFQMGGEEFANESPEHEVCFEEPFWIDIYEVSNGQYADFGGYIRRASSWADPDHPRENINWEDADFFCQKRGARLPTEAEWEYAARGPDGLEYPWGNKFSIVNVFFFAKSTKPVGSKPGNASWVGAYDLSGNVWEWVNDWHRNYSPVDQVNPQGPENGMYRVLRGGSWHDNNVISLRAVTRDSWKSPYESYSDIGFRCALSYNP